MTIPRFTAEQSLGRSKQKFQNISKADQSGTTTTVRPAAPCCKVHPYTGACIQNMPWGCECC